MCCVVCDCSDSCCVYDMTSGRTCDALLVTVCIGVVFVCFIICVNYDVYNMCCVDSCSTR